MSRKKSEKKIDSSYNVVERFDITFSQYHFHIPNENRLTTFYLSNFLNESNSEPFFKYITVKILPKTKSVLHTMMQLYDKESLLLHIPIGKLDSNGNRASSYTPRLDIGFEVKKGEDTGYFYKRENEIVRTKTYANHYSFWMIMYTEKVLHCMQGLFQYKQDFLIKHLNEKLKCVNDGDSLRRAFLSFDDGDFKQCMHFLVPYIEEAIRYVATSIGIQPFANGKYKTLGDYFQENEFLDLFVGNESQISYLQYLLRHPHGLNLRNKLAHSSFDESDYNEENCLLLFFSLIIIAQYIKPKTQPKGANI